MLAVLAPRPASHAPACECLLCWVLERWMRAHASNNSKQVRQTLTYVVGAKRACAPCSCKMSVFAGKQAGPCVLVAHMRREPAVTCPPHAQQPHKTNVMRLSPMRHGKVSSLTMTCQAHVLGTQLLLHTLSEHQAHPRGRHQGPMGLPTSKHHPTPARAPAAQPQGSGYPVPQSPSLTYPPHQSRQ